MDASVELVRHLLGSVVSIHTEVPAAHPSAVILGIERWGTGTVVDRSGLILTVNYVVMGGETIEVSFGVGRKSRAELVARLLEYERCLVDYQGELRRTHDFLGLDPDRGHMPPQREPRERELPEAERRRLAELYAPDVRKLAELLPELDVALWPNVAPLA